MGLVGGGVAVAGALVLLERRRRAQQRHRRSGRVVAPPPPYLAGGEHHLRWGADIEGARLLDVAVRAAASGSGATGLPPLRWVETGPDGVLLVLSGPSPAPAGFVSVDVDRWATTAGPDELALVAAHATAPAPTLVPVGTSDAGTEVLVELETGGVATVAGDALAGEAFLQAMVVAAATSVWSEQVRVVAVGLDQQLGRLPGVTMAGTLAEALALAEAHADRTEAALVSLRCPTLAQARAVGATPEQWDPLVVVAATAPRDLDHRRRLAALASRPNGAVGLVVRAGIEDHPSGRAFTIGDHGWLQVAGVDEPVRARLLDRAGVAALVGLLDHATDRTDAPPGAQVAELAPRRPPPPPPPPPVSRGGCGRGRPDVDRWSAPSRRRRPCPRRARRPTGARPPSGWAACSPTSRSWCACSARSRRSASTGPTARRGSSLPASGHWRRSPTSPCARPRSTARTWRSASSPTGPTRRRRSTTRSAPARALVGDELFPAPGSGRYELSPSVVTDYGVFCELVATADETEDAEAAADLLADALGLVRGEPFTGAGRGYAWVGPHRGMIVTQVVDAAEELAEVRLATGDWRAAEWAARQGLRAFPSDERMYRLLMRTARAAGNVPGVNRVFRELCDVLADPDFGVEPEDTVHPETIELLEELTGSVARQRGLGA